MSLPLPVYRDRPAFIPHAGGRIYISVHDAEYFRQRSEWRRKLAEAHPDSGGSAFTFRRLKSQRDKWEAAEVAWYQQYGLAPPEITAERPPSLSPELLALADAGGQTTRLRVMAHLALHPDATPKAIAEALGIRRNLVSVTLTRMRQDPAPRKPSRAGLLVRLLADGRPHTPAECAAAIGMRHSNELHRAIDTLNALGFDVLSSKRPGERTTYRLLGISAR